MRNRIRALALTLTALVAWSLAPPAHAADRHLNYAAVGDSITEGVGTSDWRHNPDGTWTRVAWRWSYAEQADVRPLGVGGACMSDGCGAQAVLSWLPRRLSELGRRPTTLVFHLGVNDLVLGASAASTIDQAKRVRRQMKDAGYRVVFGTIVPPPQNSAWSSIQPQRLVFNDWVRSQPTFVDYAKPLQCSQWLCPGLTDIGDVHVNDAGAARMAKALSDWMERDAG